MIRINENRLNWFGPLVLFIFGHVFFRLGFWLEAPPRELFNSVLVGIGAGYLFWHLNRRIILEVQSRFPGLELTQKRLGLLLMLTPLLVNAAVFFRFGLHILLDSRPAWWLGPVDYTASLGIQLFYHFVYFSVYEGRYVLVHWKETYEEKEDLIKAQWQTRFNSLKSQVNPHFLFNSLNALSALIEESPVRASRFVDELSNMYRYLLQANDEELVMLSTELKFIESYTHLLQTRYGSGLCVRTTVYDDYLTRLLPPLTLQLLVENAVKHNIILANQPLVIEIDTTENGQLRVRNNLQRKNGRVLSNGVGLSNISDKYRMLAQTDIIIQDGDGHFTVLVPLLNKMAVMSGQ